jgi:hypothetical protein
MEPEMKTLLDAVVVWRDARAANKTLLDKSLAFDRSPEIEEQQDRSIAKLSYAEVRLLEALEAVELIQSTTN